MDIIKQVKEQFFKNIKDHQMSIVSDNNGHRHITFKRPESSVYHFNLTTWPGYLCISGDAGCYVFCRLHDMFEFFRTGVRDGDIRINPHYWGEKCVAMDKHQKIEKFSPEGFGKNVIERACHAMKVNQVHELPVPLRKNLDLEVLSRAHDGEGFALEAAMGFEWQGKALLQDFFEVSCREWDYGYIWCLHAIVWGIKKYDEAGMGKTAEAV